MLSMPSVALSPTQVRNVRTKTVRVLLFQKPSWTRVLLPWLRSGMPQSGTAQVRPTMRDRYSVLDDLTWFDWLRIDLASFILGERLWRKLRSAPIWRES